MTNGTLRNRKCLYVTRDSKQHVCRYEDSKRYVNTEHKDRHTENVRWLRDITLYKEICMYIYIYIYIYMYI